MVISLVAQTVKNLPAMLEIPVQSLSQEEPLEKGMATHSSSFAWEIPWTEEPGGLQSTGLQRVGHDCACTHLSRLLSLRDEKLKILIKLTKCPPSQLSSKHVKRMYLTLSQFTGYINL